MGKIYQVGGFVRDRLMGVRSKDIDYACEFPSYQHMVEWIRTQGNIFLESPEFWTVRAHLKGKQPADFVLCRKDGEYGDGRRPNSVGVGTLIEDLSRRDFTVNAIAYDEETDQYIDPHNGLEDIKTKLLRCVGDPKDRFFEDALRMLRAIRFAITKGFAIHETVSLALKNRELAERLRDNVSEERKREELHRCFACNTLLTMDYLHQYDRLRDACFAQGTLWLMPTMQKAK